ncbi:MAG: AAA family ATPase [Chloroflexi bacterium]|nr:MAG: AAA family ATPase [Chloroflexota bacterium]PIE81175.1 MAG: AAA family ATPase [Chloroflexota bacterium]
MLSSEMEKIMTRVMDVEELGVPIGIVQDIIFRLLFNEGEASVAQIAIKLGLHATIVDELLSHMKQEHLVEIKKTGGVGSFGFIYNPTEAGTKRARDAFDRSQYVGRVPVSLDSYRAAILAQTTGNRQVTQKQVQDALSHLILPESFHRRIGPAVNSGSSLFLYGPPGNGKTTIAEAISKMLANDDPIWLPDAVAAGGQIIRILDPLIHHPLGEEETKLYLDPFGNGKKMRLDQRWRLFKRPAVMVGGELTMDSLDLRFEPVAKVYEAPLQMKANGGMFLIDDFGRQQMRPQDLLNRWIVPLENNIDFLRLRSGQTLEVPFEQLIVFSTNLDPNELVDDAFLRRIQMKVRVDSPDEKLFFQIFMVMCKSYKVPFDRRSFVHLLQKWYRESGRVLQAVHPRDILKIVTALCDYEGTPPRMTPALIDEACFNYFVDANKSSSWGTPAQATAPQEAATGTP